MTVTTDIAIRFIKKRTGEVEDFDMNRIKVAITKAYTACNVLDTSDINDILKSIAADLAHKQDQLNENDFVSVEVVQDIVEKNLVKLNKYDIAKQYILYRAKRQEERTKEHSRTVKKFENEKLKVVKCDGSKEDFSIEKIERVFNYVVKGYEDVCTFAELEDHMKKYIIENIKTADIFSLLVKSAIDLISIENTARQFIAGRLAMLDMYKKASKNRKLVIGNVYSGESFKDLFDDYIARGLYYKDFYKYYSEAEIIKAGDAIVKDRDFDYNYTTALMYKRRYLLNPNKVIKELPQEMYMAAALFLAIPEPDETRFEIALKIYDACSNQEISLPTPTLLNARTNFHQLSSCFKMNVEDDLRGIYHSIENMAQISKFGGGIGVYMGHVRSKGASIRGNKGASGGALPWMKVINDTAIAVNQLGARKGAISVTLDVRHRDIHDFLDMQTETGDIRRKAFDLFPAVSFPDMFFKRLENGESWTLFDPKEVEDVTGKRLENMYGEEFEAFYLECEQNDKLEMKETVHTKDLFKTYLKTVVETGMPYAFFRDTANKLNPNKHEGMVYSTQLCTEIIQNVKAAKFIEETIEDGVVHVKYQPGEMVVCNLASINVAKVNTPEKINKVIPTAMRILDNVITLNFYPTKEAEHTAMKYRSVGLGFLGVAEYLAVNKINYDSPQAVQAMDKLFEQYAFATLQSSADLAVDRGHYELFPGSDWSKGLLFGRDVERYHANTENGDKREILINQIKTTGVRFSYHLSPAPNTSTALVVGTTA